TQLLALRFLRFLFLFPYNRNIGSTLWLFPNWRGYPLAHPLPGAFAAHASESTALALIGLQLSLLLLILSHLLFLGRSNVASTILIVSTASVVFYLELAVASLFRNRVHSQRAGQIFSESRRGRRLTRENARVVKLLSYSRRQINFPATPRRVNYCIPQRSQGQRIKRWMDLRK